jgi:chromosome segregation ATPase
LDKRLAKEL